ncbi:MAG TPA: periplasmic heavy metal sensor [Gemmatimonadaceae bacterium]|nr:periplasmic heavy metal sensor [Gemmatimonadaceae bacterium]
MTNRTCAFAITLVLALAAAPAVRAQEGQDKAIEKQLFPPELVMQQQQRIGLRPEQREAITEAIQQTQHRLVDLQWRMQAEAQKLLELLERPAVDEAAVLAQVDRALAVEREVKRAQMTLLIRIKNTLTPEQQATLRTLR